MEGEQTSSLAQEPEAVEEPKAVQEPEAVEEPEAAEEPEAVQEPETQSEEPPQEPVKTKPKPKAPKEQCPICLRWYSLARVAPGMHKCVPPVPKPKDEYDREGRPMPLPPAKDAPTEEPPPAPVEPLERQINYDDIMRFLTRERMSRHERKRERWAQQMFG